MARVEKGLKIKSTKLANAEEGGGEEDGEEFQVVLDFPWQELKISSLEWGGCKKRGSHQKSPR